MKIHGFSLKNLCKAFPHILPSLSFDLPLFCICCVMQLHTLGVVAYALCKRNTVALCYVSAKIFKEVYLL